MQNSFPDKVILNVRKIPLLLSKKNLYRMSDFSYGEWILFENGEPRYYLYVFDELYSGIRDQFNPNVETYLKKKFKEKGLTLSTREVRFGIPLSSKSQIVELSLEKLPLNFLL